MLKVRMETNDERRKRRLALLCERSGGVRAVADKAGLGWEALDQVLKGTLLPPKSDGTRSPRSLGEPAARAIEEAFDLGTGWLDWPFDAVDFKRYAALSPTQKGVVQARMSDAIAEVEGQSLAAGYKKLVTKPRVKRSHVARKSGNG
jgi:hypothetical protein